jgi:hypothetical protein
MWIQLQNQATRRLYNEEVMDEPVEFASTGRAQVPDDVGERLVAHYDEINHYEGSEDA